jgi:hypothetical protein
MRHPAAPTIIAILLGFLAFMVVWARWRGDGHHEGNPHPNDVPAKRTADGSERPTKKSSEKPSGADKDEVTGSNKVGADNAVNP